MLLAIDIGNSNITIGLFDNDRLINNWRLVSSSKKTVDDYAIDMVELFLTNKIDCLKINGCIIASVVPILTTKIYEAVKKFISETIAGKILIVGQDSVKLDIEIELKNKNEVGCDRLINSIAAYKKFGGNLIIVDFGTATTFDVVGDSGEYLGGVIAPGVNLSLKALHEMTAQLPKISMKPQQNVIGKNTFEAINSGAYFGYISLVEGIIKRIKNELQTNKKITTIITGGLSEIFNNSSDNLFDYCEPNLTLEGLKIVYQNRHD